MEHGQRRFQDQPDVQPDGAGADVGQIHIDPLRKGDVIPVGLHLPHTGQTRRDTQAHLVVAGVVAHLRGQRRAGPHQGHLPLEDVDQLRQLIQAGTAQEAAHTGDARIFGNLEDRAILLVHLLQGFLPGLRIHAHGAELVHQEVLLVPPHPSLLEEGAALGIVDHDGQRDQQQHRRKRQQPQRGSEHIQQTLAQPVMPPVAAVDVLQQHDPPVVARAFQQRLQLAVSFFHATHQHEVEAPIFARKDALHRPGMVAGGTRRHRQRVIALRQRHDLRVEQRRIRRALQRADLMMPLADGQDDMLLMIVQAALLCQAREALPGRISLCSDGLLIRQTTGDHAVRQRGMSQIVQRGPRINQRQIPDRDGLAAVGAGILCAQEARDAHNAVAVLPRSFGLIIHDPLYSIRQPLHPLSAHGHCILCHRTSFFRYIDHHTWIVIILSLSSR